MVCLYGLVPLFISRIEPATAVGALHDGAGGLYRVERRHGLHYLLSSKPLCLFGKRARIEAAGISSFIIDLAFHAPDGALLESLLEHYRNRTAVGASTQFNFKLGLK
jgi:hypothetical protein